MLLLLLLWVVVLSHLRTLGRCFLFSGNQPHQMEGEEIRGTRGRGGQAVPPAREGRESSTIERKEDHTELN